MVRLDRIGPDRIRLAWIGLDWIGLDSGSDPRGPVWLDVVFAGSGGINRVQESEKSDRAKDEYLRVIHSSLPCPCPEPHFSTYRFERCLCES